MKISVAMTTYNGERFIQEQLRSLIEQERQPDEVIICDDGSKDATVAVIQAFISDHSLCHWKLICNEKNLGYVDNFRKAIAVTTGDLVFLCDQDDVWLPEKLSRMEQIMIDKPQVMALACGYRLIDGQGAELPEESLQLTRRGIDKLDEKELARVDQGSALYSNIAQGCACAYRREIAEQYCGADNACGLAHDWALNFLAHEKQGLYFLNEKLLDYRIHGNNTIGIASAKQAVTGRIPLLQEYAGCISQAEKLPQSQTSLAFLKEIENFTLLRVQWLRSRKPGIWLKGFVRYFPVMKRCFFLQYMKDLYLGLTGKCCDCG